jgi:hypothetical protein
LYRPKQENALIEHSMEESVSATGNTQRNEGTAECASKESRHKSCVCECSMMKKLATTNSKEDLSCNTQKPDTVKEPGE